MVGGLEMTFRLIPPGTFLMGSPAAEVGREDYRQDSSSTELRGVCETLHPVTITRGFWLGVHPITQGQWLPVMATNVSKFPDDHTRPAEMVTWEDCRYFCRMRAAGTEHRLRLPIEKEWEWACRAGTTTPFFFGETLSTEQANSDGDYTYGQGEKGVSRKKTTPVGSFPPNAWGLFDMHGNVWEWCAEWDGCYVREGGTGRSRTPIGVRGGSWCSPPALCRSVCREGGDRDFLFGVVGCGCRICLCLD
jgi:formylglycine-generating enzyme required for sulfatase activity